ncbi:MAG: hypothetical protein KDE56_09735 [Anaerolineales bacterium]|nr:hypothetical protein [Anaerolineales bacterium]
MRQFYRSRSRNRRVWGGLLALSLALLFLYRIAQAVCGGGNLSDFCSSNFGLSGNLTAVGSPTGNSLPAVDGSRLPTAGALFYADYKLLETEARDLLERNMNFRRDISPYQPNNNFNKLVRQFDINSGFSAPYDDPNPAIPTMTLQQRIDLADADLRQARDLYAFLAVYAPVIRMRADDGKDPDNPGPNYKGQLCAQPEDPNPPHPPHTGQVLDPVIDWCDFSARLRQSVREAAYLRMIFAQQFMVDALGLHFSAGVLLGGDAFVRQEVAKLEAAEYQYDLAEQGLRQPLEHALGSGCLISDFYTQSEWALLARAAQSKEVAQHHIATRLGYLDIKNDSDIPRAQANAQDAFRAASTEGYLKMVSLAGTAVIGASTSGCAALGANPDGALVAEMAINLLDTRAAAHEMREGRNVFGMDIRFTPARPYHTAFGSTDKGLWEQARDAANLALQIQQQTENAERVFDLNQQELAKAVLAINNKIDNEIQIEAGCDLQNFLNEPDPDGAWYACIDDMIKHTQECDPMANSFDACMNRTTDGQPPKVDGSNWLILVSDMRSSRQDLRTAWLGIEAAILKRDNIVQRANTEVMRNIKVKSAIINGAQDASVFEAIVAAANCCTLEIGFPPSFSTNPGAFVEAGLRPGQILKQAAHDMDIEDANSEAVVRNLFYDMAEAQGEIDIAVQQFQSQLTQFNGVVGQTLHDVFESKRQHAYATALPANDPSYRMVRDSRRIELAQALETASRLAYLAGRRAEYEYTARLSASNFRISDIYKARTANDILLFLQNLDVAIANLPGAVQDADSNQRDLTISVAQHLLGLTDAYLKGQGVPDANLQAERERRFRQWVAQNTWPGSDGKPQLLFTFSTSSATNGLIGQVVQQGYDYYWLHKVAGIGQPKPTSNGFGINLLTEQNGEFGYRQVRVSQSGQVGLTSYAGCLFDYRLIPPAVLLGLEYPGNQPTDVVSGAFNGDVNGQHGNTTPGYSTPAFLGRPLAANEWQVVVSAGSPNGILPDMDLQKLSDIELKISTTYGTRASNSLPQPSQCVRVDY